MRSAVSVNKPCNTIGMQLLKLRLQNCAFELEIIKQSYIFLVCTIEPR